MAEQELDLKPYLLEASYTCIMESGLTPYIQAVADYPGIICPESCINKGFITLNLNADMLDVVEFTKEEVTLHCSVQGKITDIYLPMGCIVALYAGETLQGISFEVVEAGVVEEARPVRRVPVLSIVGKK